MLGGVAFCVAFGDSVEWSLACPGSGMAESCWVLLMSDLAEDAVPTVSFAVPTCSTPSTFARGSLSAADPMGTLALGGAADLSVQAAETAASIVNVTATVRGLMFMVIYFQLSCGAC